MHGAKSKQENIYYKGHVVLVTMAVTFAIKKFKNSNSLMEISLNMEYILQSKGLIQYILNYKYIGSFILFCKGNTMYI